VAGDRCTAPGSEYCFGAADFTEYASTSHLSLVTDHESKHTGDKHATQFYQDRILCYCHFLVRG